MHGEGFFYQAFMYLAAAVIAVPVAKRLGLGSVLGYLIAGIAIGPFVLGLLGTQGQSVMHFAEFGVVMMLFLVGLELEPALLWRLRAPVIGLGGLQVVGTTVAIGFVAWLFGTEWKVAIACGMILALSSTAIVLQTLNEKGLMKTGSGQSAFAVLLFQDIAVIPMLAVLPLLAPGSAEHAPDAAHADNWVSGLPGWAATLVILVALAALIASGRFVLRPVFRFIAQARLRETFTAAALLLVIGIAILMTKLGLSPALGTFVAGVVLATSEYRHELEAEIEPFKGLLLGLFFIAVGASIDFGLVGNSPELIAGLLLALVTVKIGVLFVLGRAFKMSLDQNLLFAFALAQGGEFAFVLFSFATQNAIIPEHVAGLLVATVAISMALTPLVMIFVERVLLPRVGTRQRDVRPEDEVHGEHPVIVAGYGRFGQIVARLLSSAGYSATLLDIDSDQVDLARKYGARVFYGDASRYDLLRAAGAEQARMLVLALDNPAKTLEMAHTVKKHFPHLHILARATGRREAFELMDAGVNHIYRELFDSSLRLGTDALRLLGMPAYQAHRVARSFRRHDEASLRETAAHRHDEKAFITVVKQRNQDVERVLHAEQHTGYAAADRGWERQEATRGDSSNDD